MRPHELLSLLTELQLAAVAFAPADGQLLGATPAARTELGLASHRFEGQAWRARLQPLDVEKVLTALADPPSEALVLRLSRDDLGLRAFQLALHRRDGFVLGLIQPLPRDAASAEPELEALLQALPFDVWERDAEGVLVRQNATARQNWNAPLGSSIAQMGLPPDVAALWSAMVRRALAGEVVRAQQDYEVGARRLHYVNVLAPVREAGRIRGVVGVNLDVTAARTAEAERDELLEKERAARRQLEQAQAQLVQRERYAALGELAAVVAHEVRNPLAVIFNVLSELRRAVAVPGRPAELLDILDEEAARLTRTVGDLLNFVRPLAPDRKPVDLVELAREALDAALRSTMRHSGPVLGDVVATAPLPPVAVDAGLVRIALDNVLVNAIQAMPEGGQLEVRVGPLQQDGRPAARIEVRDTGRGIPPDVLPRVFEPFFTTRASGTGIGLAVVRRIAEAHGGAVEARSGPGPGATFTLDLAC